MEDQRTDCSNGKKEDSNLTYIMIREELKGIKQTLGRIAHIMERDSDIRMYKEWRSTK